MAKPDDEQLLVAAQAGDRDALEKLLTAHQHRVFRFGVKMCGEEARCDSLRATLSLCSESGEQLPPRVERSVREALRRFLDAQP